MLFFADPPELPEPDLLELPLFDPEDFALLGDFELADFELPEDFELPDDFDPLLPLVREPAVERELPLPDRELPDDALLPDEADLPEELLPADDFDDDPEPLPVLPADFDELLFFADDPLFADDEELLFFAPELFVPDADFDAPDDPVPFAVPFVPTPPVMSAAVDAAPITAPFAAPDASSVTIFAASSSTFVTVLLPDDFLEPDPLVLLFAAILLASFFVQAHHAPCRYTKVKSGLTRVH